MSDVHAAYAMAYERLNEAADEIERLRSSLEDSLCESERLRAEVSRLRAAIEEHRLCSQGWRDASETDKTLWAAKYEEVSDE